MPHDMKQEAASRMAEIAKEQSLEYTGGIYSEIEITDLISAKFTEPSTGKYYQIVFDPKEEGFQQFSCSDKDMSIDTDNKKLIKELKEYIADLEAEG